MKYPEFQRMVLQLINLYSIHGHPLPSSYNDVGDYAVRIPALLNTALDEIAALTQEYMTKVPLSELEELDPGEDGCRRYLLPEDLLSDRGAYLMTRRRHCFDAEPAEILFSVTEGTDILIVEGEAGSRRSATFLHYRRLPDLVDTTPGADLSQVTLDGSPEVLNAAAFFAASMLVLQDDAFTYSALRNEYSDRLEHLLPRTLAAPVRICDAYGLM